MKEKTGARDCTVEVIDVNHAIARFETKRYGFVSIKVGVDNDSPGANKEATVLAMGENQIEASFTWTEFDLECSATLTASKQRVIEISRSGIRSASRRGENISLDSEYLLGSHILRLSESMVEARPNMPGGELPTTWDVICSELKG